MIARLSAGAVIRALLGLQLALGALLVAGDVTAGWPGPGLRDDAPDLDAPVRPGDQTRRYDPADRPARAPGTPLPATPRMPTRLHFEADEIDGRAVLRLAGQIAPGDAARLSDWLEAAEPAPLAVLLDSPGGSVADALAIGRTLRERGLETGVLEGELCLSACPYILAGGTVRRAAEGALVGVHQHYFGESAVQPAFLAVEDIQRGQGLVLGYLDEMGIDLRLMGPALLTPPDEIYILLPQELRDFALVTPDP